MQDFSELPMIPPELMLGAERLPPPDGPVRLCFSGRPMRERTPMLRECFARIGYRYEFTPLPHIPCEIDLALNTLPDMTVVEGRLQGSRNRRTRAIIDDANDEAVLMVNLRGKHLIEQFGREVVLGDGDAILISGTDPSCFTHQPPGNILGFRVPKSRLEPMLHDRTAAYMQRVPATTATLGLLRAYAGLTWDRHLAGNTATQRLMSDHLFDLMAMVAGASRDTSEIARQHGLHAARLHAVKQDIARNLERPDLSVALLAGRHNCTPRSLQRLFEAEGTTFTRYVLEQRLQRAHRLLVDPRRCGEKISSVALDCGFGDVSYFNRTFRQQFGAAPSEVRAGARQLPG